MCEAPKYNDKVVKSDDSLNSILVDSKDLQKITVIFFCFNLCDLVHRAKVGYYVEFNAKLEELFEVHKGML